MKNGKIKNIIYVVVVASLFSLMAFFTVKSNSKNLNSNNQSIVVNSSEEIALGSIFDDVKDYINNALKPLTCLQRTKGDYKACFGSTPSNNNSSSTPVVTPEPCLSSVTFSGVETQFTPSEASGRQFVDADAFSTSGGAASGVKWSVSGPFTINSAGVVRFSSVTPGKGATPTKHTATVTANYGSCGPKSITKSAYVYSCNWSSAKGFWKNDKGRMSYTGHFWNSGCNFYGNLIDGKYFKTFYSRCCQVAPENDYGFCYGDEPYIGIARNVKWVDGPEQNFSGWYRYEDIKDKKDCKLMESASACKTGSTVTPAKEYQTKSCEDTVTFETKNSSKVCSSGSANFFNIDCTTTVTTSFDMDDNLVNSSYSLYKGQGFKYNIGEKERIACRASFNSSEWLKTYNNVMAKMKTVKAIKRSSESAYEAYQSNSAESYQNFIEKLRSIDGSLFTRNTESYIYELYTLARDVEQIVIDYNNHAVPEDNNTESNLKMAYTINGANSKKTYSYDFVSEKQSCNPIKKVTKTHNDVTSAAKWLTAPKDFSEIYEKVVNLYPKLVSISKDDGTVTEKEERVLEGGNKIYIDNNASIQTISPITINVTGLARNKSSILNDKCSIKVVDRNMIYRPIDVKNPFIGDTWKKGENWTNSLYDFTNTIHSDTWSRNSLYTINLSQDMITAIKESNKKNSNSAPYLGLCDRLDDSMQDSITRKLCSIIK